MRMDRSGRYNKAVASALLLGVLSCASVWADGGYYDNNGYQRVYSDQSGAYTQNLSRIEPETRPYQAQYYQQPPLRASTSASSPPHKALSTKIGEGFSDLWRSPTLKSGVAGAGIGLGAAALTKHALWHGTWVGAAYGAGVGVMDEINFFKRHPLVRKTAKGAVIGLGAAAVSGAAALGPAAAVGAGVGLGVHYLKMH